MKFLSIPVALMGVSLSSLALANDDGFFNVSYDNIGFDLTQIGSYGELIIKPQGFGNMAFGNCSVNFKRNADGSIAEMTPIVQQSSAKCPEKLAFSVAPGEKGLYKITFSEGGDLAGQSFDLFPVLRPMSDEFKVTAPKGFDILGTTIGMKRSEIKAALSAEGYTLVEAYNEVTEYQDGTVSVQEIWGKGENVDYRGPEDTIAFTYSAVVKGSEDEAPVEVMARKWSIPASANLSVANLKKSLADKHGAVTSQFEARHYNRAGELQPAAFQPVCADNVHLQQVSTKLSLVGEGEELSVSASCGASVDIMVLESFETAGLANLLKVKLVKGDVAYSAFWDSWSKREAGELQKRFEIQAGMNSTAPKL